MSDVVVSSTTDMQESVNAAAGVITAHQESEPGAKAESGAESETAQAENKEGESKGKSAKDRISELVKQRNTARDQNAELQKRLEAIEKRLPSETQATASSKPTPDKFATYEEYVESLADWKAEQRITEALKKSKETATHETEAERQRTTFESYNERVAEAHSRYDDFDEVVGNPDLQIPEAALLAIVEMENGPDVAYHLGKNPEICKQLAGMTPVRAVAEVGRLSAKLVPAETPEGSPEEKPAKQLPSPIKPIGGASAKPAVNTDEADYQTYKRERQKELNRH